MNTPNPQPPKPRLRGYDPARASRAAKIGAGYTWFVRIARLALPLCALVIVGVVIFRLSGDDAQQPARLAEMPAEEKTVPGEIDMVEVKYQGADAEGRLYTVTAAHARRDMSAPSSLTLDKPRADIALDGDKWLAAHAEKGLYDNDAGSLYLSDGVTLFHDDGYELKMQDMRIALKTRTGVTEKPVSLQGPAALLNASGMNIDSGGEVIVFSGPVHVTLHGLGREKRGG
ncbi:MAG TPA: LPS export ABC transporter periplasmic protein LptC [Alphaproteobacteria bacterium]|nr:LPS export ABC transporter periplasmic protein LptC [Alphaproteobacteria bacterium]